ncbi:histidine phosphatase family protein [Streptomyces sp. A7024]|uniref:Histidine phosphatase family protein n=1 Tax=Streptomyces coryli TaxID=1128680 RepID=A0A6G4TYJ0_9ACTN|nr:histidine phosphatase family protein [Streptomyces coryli]NGN64188.1 histidine phosphatase family protein [Streptomyces coryli]
MSVETARSIILLRHAKADWPQVSDHDRPLAERGRKEAPLAGDWLAKEGLAPDRALCSTAVRTRETWKLVVPKLPARPKTVYEDRLYEASLGELIAVVNETPDDVRNLIVIGHNPGVHALADALSARADDDAAARMNRSGFPTAAIAVVSFAGDWKSVEHGMDGTLTHFWTSHT